MNQPPAIPTNVADLLAQVPRPPRVIVTSGMPYANGPLHLGHVAGVHVPADVFSRYMGMLIGRENVLYVNGTDDHGSTSEVAALKAGKPIQDFIGEIHAKQRETLRKYSIAIDDAYTGTSRPETYEIHKAQCQDMLRRLHRNGMLEKRVSEQWYDPTLNRFLPDRYVKGRCPNPKCENESAYSDECEVCGLQYEPKQLINPKSALSDAIPVMKATTHLWLDMWKVAEVMRVWIEGKQKEWRKPILAEVLGTLLPAFSFEAAREEEYKAFKAELPKHKPRYAPGKKIALQFENRVDFEKGRQEVEKRLGLKTELVDGWAHRSITRDVAWGIPVPEDIDPELKGKTLYVWPDSLIAPISFTKVALKARGQDPKRSDEFWRDPAARVYQFIGQDNVFFYVLMQGAMWLGSQEQTDRLPQQGELQLTDIFSVYHLMVGGEKMSKSRGNFYTADQLVGEMKYDPDQIRYFLSTLSLPEKQSNFDLTTLDERNRFLAGPMNAAFEKPISAAHSKFEGKIPAGKLVGKVEEETFKLVRLYLKAMGRADYANLLGMVENYARQINSLFTQFKPHDDRHPADSRADALYSCFYVLKNIMIMLYPFVPATMNRLRETLKLPETVFRLEELGKPIAGGHAIGPMGTYFPGSSESKEVSS